MMWLLLHAAGHSQTLQLPLMLQIIAWLFNWAYPACYPSAAPHTSVAVISLVNVKLGQC
jgi:hypothetical protein